jgi:hypothetical protein
MFGDTATATGKYEGKDTDAGNSFDETAR